MEDKDDLTGKLARLPDGQLVTVEEVHSDGYATVRRIEGERKETIAICKISKLLPDEESATIQRRTTPFLFPLTSI